MTREWKRPIQRWANATQEKVLQQKGFQAVELVYQVLEAEVFSAIFGIFLQSTRRSQNRLQSRRAHLARRQCCRGTLLRRLQSTNAWRRGPTRLGASSHWQSGAPQAELRVQPVGMGLLASWRGLLPRIARGIDCFLGKMPSEALAKPFRGSNWATSACSCSCGRRRAAALGVRTPRLRLKARTMKNANAYWSCASHASAGRSGRP